MRAAVRKALARMVGVGGSRPGVGGSEPSTTERHVQRALAEPRCTRVVIAHRPGTFRDADVIRDMDEGRGVELGRHEGPLARGDVDAALVGARLDLPRRATR